MLRPIRTVAPASAIITTSEAKAWCDVTYTADDTLIGGLVAAADAQLDGYTGILGRCLLNQTWRLNLPTWPITDVIRLPFPDVSAITSIKYYDSAGSQQTVSAALYELQEDEESGFVAFKDAFTFPTVDDDRLDSVEILFVSGFGATASAAPDGIKTAAKMMVAHWYENREATVNAEMRELPMGVSQLLAPYRRRRV